MAKGGKLTTSYGEEPKEIEREVSNALRELQADSEIGAELRKLYFVGAKEIDVNGQRAIIIFVPVPLLDEYHKIQPRLVRQLEKKFSGKHVVVIANRRILPKPKRGRKSRTQKQKRPRSRTLTAVHEEVLHEVVYPARVVGKWIKIRLGGPRIIKVSLDKLHKENVEYKLDTFSGVYKYLTGKDVAFEFSDPLF